MRWVLDDLKSAEAALSLCASCLATAVGLRVHGIVTHAGAETTATVDVLASRDHARGGMARRGPRIVLATERGVASAGAVAPLDAGALLAVLGATGDPSAALPDAARSLVRERRARVLSLSLGQEGDGVLAIAATITGAAVAVASRVVRAPIDGAFVGRLVTEQIAAWNDIGAAQAEAAGERARRSFEATRDVLALEVSTGRDGDQPDPGRPIGIA